MSTPLEEAQAALAKVDAELADALSAKDEAWQVWANAKSTAKAISDRRDEIAEFCWALEKEARDADEAEFREFYNKAKLSGADPLKLAGVLNGGSDG